MLRLAISACLCFALVACGGGGDASAPPLFNVTGTNWFGTIQYSSPVVFSVPVNVNMWTTNAEGTSIEGWVSVQVAPFPIYSFQGSVSGNSLYVTVTETGATCTTTYGLPGTLSMAGPATQQLSASFNFVACNGTGPYVGTVTITRSTLDGPVSARLLASAREIDAASDVAVFTTGELSMDGSSVPMMEVLDSKNRELVGHLGLQELMLAPLAPGTKLRWRPLATGKEADLTVIAAW